MALEKQRVYRKNIDGTKDLLYRETSADVVKYQNTTVERKLETIDNYIHAHGDINGVNITDNAIVPKTTNGVTVGTLEKPMSTVFSGTINNNTNGSCPLTNKVKMKWGGINISIPKEIYATTETTINLSNEFLQECVYADANCNKNSSWNNFNSIGVINVTATIIDKNTIKIHTYNVSPIVENFTFSFKWFAIGY